MKKTFFATVMAISLASAASAVPIVDGDFGFIDGGAEAMNGALRNDDLDWYSFDVRAGSTYIDILARERRDSGIDAEIGLYAADGMLIGDDDDWNVVFGGAALSYGTGSGTGFEGRTLSGDDGGMLSAGQYFVSVSRFNTTFGDDFDVDAPTEDTRDRYRLIIKSDVAAVPLPAALPLMGFAIAGLGALGLRRRTKS